MGFKALATTSSGFAWTLGRPDNQVTLDEALEHLRLVADAVAVPVNADFEGGYAVDPEQVNANVKLAVSTGIAGLSMRTRPATRRIRFMTSIWPWSAFGPHDRRSMRAAPASF